MNCNEFKTLITPAVDGLLEGRERSAFDQHAQVCPSCRTAYELEAAVKGVVRRKIPLVQTPDAVRAAILKDLCAADREAAREAESGSPWGRFRSWLSRPTFQLLGSGIILVVAGIAITLLLREHSAGALPQEENLVVQVTESYKALRLGSVQPQVVSENPETLRSFLSAHAAFPINVPAIREFTPMGGLAGDYHGIQQVRLFYKRGTDFLEVTQQPLADVLHGRGVTLPLDVRDDLMHRGWFAGTADSRESVLLWTRGVTLCSAVAMVNKEELQHMLTETEENAGIPTPW